jgi:hypothetical protein
MSTMAVKTQKPNFLPEFLNFYLFLIVVGIFAAPLGYAWVFHRFVSNSVKNLYIKNFLIYFTWVWMGILTPVLYIAWAESLGLNLIDNIPFANILWWSSELFHFLIFVIFLWCTYRVVRYKITPYSALYIALYQGVHVIYNGCPVSEVQNWITNNGGPFAPIDNTFWRGVFVGYEIPARLVFVFIVGIFVALTYVQFQRLDYGREKWLDFWLEPSLNKYQK